MVATRNETIEHLRTVVELLLERAAMYRADARLWATNPGEFGTTEVGIAEWSGKGQGFEIAAKMLREKFSL